MQKNLRIKIVTLQDPSSFSCFFYNFGYCCNQDRVRCWLYWIESFCQQSGFKQLELIQNAINGIFNWSLFFWLSIPKSPFSKMCLPSRKQPICDQCLHGSYCFLWNIPNNSQFSDSLTKPSHNAKKIDIHAHNTFFYSIVQLR